MVIQVRVKPRAHGDSVQAPLDTNGTYIVSITQPPVDGKANQRVIELLAEYFGVAKSLVTIVSGMTSRNKRVEIEEGRSRESGA